MRRNVSLLILLVTNTLGIEFVKIDEIINANGLFGDQEILLPSSGLGGISQAVTQLGTLMSTTGILDVAYKNFARQYNKVPGTSGTRKELFRKDVLAIFSHNLRERQGLESFTTGINKFSDMSLDEVRAKFTGAILPNDTNTNLFKRESPSLRPAVFSTRAAPSSRDWRSYGAVTPPKNQGSCGSCTFFALTGVLESAMALYQGKKDLDLSEQELLDCVTGRYVYGCNGNWPGEVYDYLKEKGQVSESSYKYEGEQKSCRSAGKAKIAKISNYFKITKGDEQMLKEYVGQYGPCSVIIQINEDFKRYRSGVMRTPCPEPKSYDHSVVVVGYGTENGIDHWIVKNSWDTNWGDKGYIKMARNANNLCLIADYGFLGQA